MKTNGSSRSFGLGCAVSSVVEHYLDTVGVTGSNPVSRTIFSEQNEGFYCYRTDSAQIPSHNEPKVKFPVTIRHRQAKATIYGRTEGYPFYRVACRVAGKRVLRSFAAYGDARRTAEKLVRQISSGDQSVALTPKESTDALAIRDALAAHRRDTGRTVTALQAVTHFLHASKLLGERPLSDAVEGYLRTVAVVKRKDVAAAVAEFVASRALKAKGKDGKRSALNAMYVANTATALRKFGATFPGHSVNDLTKAHLSAYMGSCGELSVKSRNDRRAIVKQFLRWCARNDYLSQTHRLFEADGLAMEPKDTAPVDFYRPNELAALLASADLPMRAVIALQALAGLRLEEALRLDWCDVFGIPGHVEVSTAKSKTRQRRLVEICPALESWLAPFRSMTGLVGAPWRTVGRYVQVFIKLRESLKIPSRRNGLRHGFVTFHFALHQNENVTSAQAGNSPAMIHAHYKGLATKAEASKWFNVLPPESAKNVIPLSSVTNA